MRLGEVLRHFQQNICMAYETKELKREVKARTRKTTKKTNKSASGTHAASAALPAQEVASGPSKVTGKLRKTLNLNTYKDHSLGDYVESIRRYGTVDSYSTEMVNQILVFIPLSSW